MTSPLQPKQVTSEQVVVGFLDVGLNKEKRPMEGKAERSWPEHKAQLRVVQ